MNAYSLNTYNLYRHDLTGRVEAVKIGFSWPAFFCGPFWAFSKKAWELASGILGGGIFVSLGAKLASFTVIILIGTPAIGGFLELGAYIGYMYVIASYGNKSSQLALVDRGYDLVSQAYPGTSPRDAISRYYADSSTSRTV